MGNLIARFGAYQRVQGFTRRTIDRRTWSLGHWQRHLARDARSLDQATADDLETFLGRWESAQSRQSIRSDLRQFYGWAIRRGHLTCIDPTDDVPAPKVPQRASTPIPADVVRGLIDSLPRGTDRLLVMLGAYAGLRISEMGALRAEDVDISARQILVRGKGGVEEVIPLARELVEELRQWPTTGRYVALNGPGCGRRLRNLFRRRGIAARPHDLRHSFGTQAARRTNGNLVVVQRLMRHAQVSTTVRYVKWHTTGHEVVDGMFDEPPAA